MTATPVPVCPGIPAPLAEWAAALDGLHARIAPLLPPPRARPGRPAGAHRPILGGLLWMMHYGASWRETPAEFGPWQTLYNRYRLWRRDGTWAHIVGPIRHGDAAGGVATCRLI